MADIDEGKSPVQQAYESGIWPDGVVVKIEELPWDTAPESELYEQYKVLIAQAFGIPLDVLGIKEVTGEETLGE